ncbi:MAG TPA: outer membrane beta-barrel protein [Candidatus Eisenbacteria bacterium]|nr:outer membrane beta-barrel protein [Candidatus Eisenbacteria bacterium]
MRRVPVPLVLLLAGIALLLAPAPAHAAWSLGANLGVTVHNPTDDGDDTVTMIGFPTQASAFSSLRPGLRIGYAGQAMTHEGYLDLSYDSQSADGDDVHAMRLAANYQYNFGANSSVKPYVTLGAGLFNFGYDTGFGSVGATAATFGGGIGMGMPVSDDRGRLRWELRYDRLGEGEDGGIAIIGEAGIISVLFGFDLWMR